MRPFDVQLMGAIVLHQGKIAEMKTGEGKTLVAPLAAALNAMSGRGVHVVTVNDYLAKRDPQWMGPIFHGLGLSVGIVQHDTAFLFDPQYRPKDETLMHLRPVPRAEAYAADVTYATNNELGFDYLRDNMVQELVERVQRDRYFAIVDEVDNILIDEARTPLIISGAGGESDDLYHTFARLVPRLEARPEGAKEGGDYFVDLKEHAVSPTEEGIAKIEKLLGVRDLYDVETDPRLPRHFEQALRAHALYKRDRDYIVKDGEIVIVDEFTGRQMPGRRWSEGLHQAIEAKEGVRVQRESVTIATITFQNYFRLYDKLSGMTGTAMTEQEEFYKIYGLDVVAIPTHRPMVREDFADLVFRDENAKFKAVIDEIAETPGGRSAHPRGHRLGREEREALGDAAPSRRPPRGPQRQVPREGSPHRGPGRPQRLRSPSPPTWPAAARTSSSAATPPGWPRRSSTTRASTRPRSSRRSTRTPSPRPGSSATRTTTRSWPRAACTSSARSATTPGASTTSCAAAPVARATPAPRASTSRSRTPS